MKRVCSSLPIVLLSAVAPLSQTQSISCQGLAATIIGTEADDAFIGTEGDDVIAGLGGDDVIRGLAGNDVQWGGQAVTFWTAVPDGI